MGLKVESREAFAVSIGVFSLSPTSVSLAAREARRQAAISSRARGESAEPISARWSGARTSLKETIGVPPRYVSTVRASSVSC